LLTTLIVAVLISGALAIIGVEFRVRWLEMVFKPLTTILLFGVVGLPRTPYAWLIVAGIVLSLAGDVALLWDSKMAFLLGLVAFLVAHVIYTIAFIRVGKLGIHVGVVAAYVSVASLQTLRAIWKGAGDIRWATLVYGLAITVMVAAAWATLLGPLPGAAFAAVGSVLFYISDTSLSRNLFARPIPHASLLTMGVYWLGQLGIAISARGGL
jgi:uncharacterized membrane protein YhhN